MRADEPGPLEGDQERAEKPDAGGEEEIRQHQWQERLGLRDERFRDARLVEQSESQ
jgi:hypothetical protein